MTTVTHLTKAASDFVQAGAVINGTNVTGTIASNNISLSVAPQTAFVFSNSNGVSFGTNGSTVTATVQTNYLTTAALSNHSHGNPQLNLTNISGTTASNSAGFTLSLSVNPAGVIAAGGSTAASTGTYIFSNLNGISFSLNGSTITASHNALTSQSNQNITAGNGGFAFQTLSFSNANGISFSTSAGSAIVASHNGLTTARASNDAVGLNTAQSNVTWTVNSSGISLDGRGYAGTGTTFGGTNISVSLTQNSNGLQMSASVAAPGGGAAVNFSGGTTSNNLQSVVFSNSNGVSFGLNGSTMTASHNGLTTAAQSNQVVNSLNGSTGVMSVTVGSSLSMSTNGSTITFGLASNITTALQSTGAYLTTAALSNHSHGNPTLNLTNLSGTTASNSAGFTLSLSAAASGAGVTPVASASNGSFSFTTLAFSNANNVTFGTSAGSIITASVAAPGAAAENNAINLLGANTAGNTTATGSTIGWSGIGVTLSGTNNSQVIISAPPVSSLVGVDGVSISTAGSTISVRLNLLSTFVPYFPISTSSQTLGALGATSASANFYPIVIPVNIAFNALRVMHRNSFASSTVSGQQTLTYNFGLFSNNANSLSLISSNSFSLAITNSSVSATVSFPVSTGTAGYTYTTTALTATAQLQQQFGNDPIGRVIDFQFGNSMSLSSGVYWLGVIPRWSSSSANIGVDIALMGNANGGWAFLAGFGQASSAQSTNFSIHQPYAGLGRFTISQSSLPNGVPLSQINHQLSIMPLISFISTN